MGHAQELRWARGKGLRTQPTSARAEQALAHEAQAKAFEEKGDLKHAQWEWMIAKNLWSHENYPHGAGRCENNEYRLLHQMQKENSDAN